MDFVHDQLATGPKLRILTVIDTFSRFSPAIAPRLSFRAPDVVEVLERVCAEVGYPASIRVDQDSEFISRDLDLWPYNPASSRSLNEIVTLASVDPNSKLFGGSD